MANQIQKTIPAIRLKITGKCNRSCSFCHQEGDMENIQDMQKDQEFSDVVSAITQATNISRVMLSGGEPMLNNHLDGIIDILSQQNLSISLTTNGIKLLSLREWRHLASRGLSKVIISIHDLSPERFLALEKIKKPLLWAEKSLFNQLMNIKNVIEANLPLRINMVVYNNFEHSLETVNSLMAIKSKDNDFEIRLLNNLHSPEESQTVIRNILNIYRAEEVGSYQKAGSSNVTRIYQVSSSRQLLVKISHPYYLQSICGSCKIRSTCYEGFYGIRIEKKETRYFVRLCVYKQSPDVLMPYKEFLINPILAQIKTESG